MANLGTSFITIKVNDNTVVGLAENFSYSFSNEATSVAFGLGDIQTANLLYQKKFAYNLNFEQFDLAAIENGDQFQLSQLNSDGSSQIIVSKRRPQVDTLFSDEYSNGTIVFSNIGGATEGYDLTYGNPAKYNFQLIALTKVDN